MDRMRSMLFCPASEPKMYMNAPVHKPDCILFDLEDAVVVSEKDGARDLLCKAVKALDFGNSKVFVRINSLRTLFGEKDVRDTVKAGIKYMRLAMCESKADVIELDQLLTEVEKEHGLPGGTVRFQCSIETAKGVLNARESVNASNRVISLSFGAEDYTNSMGTVRTPEGYELQYARTYLPLVAAEAGITAIDTVWSDINNTNGFMEELKYSKKFGFSGKSCSHPSQIRMVHEEFTPSDDEVKHAQDIMEAVKDETNAGRGVFTVNGKMIDTPVIDKAKRILTQKGEKYE